MSDGKSALDWDNEPDHIKRLSRKRLFGLGVYWGKDSAQKEIASLQAENEALRSQVEAYGEMFSTATEVRSHGLYDNNPWSVKRVEKAGQVWCAYPKNQMAIIEIEPEIHAKHFSSAIEAFEALQAAQTDKQESRES